MTDKRSAEKTVRDIRRATRRHYSAEEKIRVVLEGLRGEEIGLPVRVATIADVFTSLTTTRPFRTANTTYEAIRIMSQDMASQLDMNVLKVFIQILGV